jgi:hypothetical protein
LWLGARFSRHAGHGTVQPATIASVGHTDAQLPQSMQVSGLIQRASFFSLIAVTGHSLSQAPQLTQASVTLYAITFSLIRMFSEKLWVEYRFRRLYYHFSFFL